MANRIIYNSKIIGIAAAVPTTVSYIRDYAHFSDIEKSKFVEYVGIHEKRHIIEGVTAGDLCEAAANQLILENNINKDEIDALVFVCQTRDYIYPCTSTVLQHKLKLPKTCLAFDVPLGCSGYIYGITILTALMESGSIKKGLLLAGDTCTLTASPKDKTFFPLLGDAGTATLIEYDENARPIYSTMYSDGNGYQDLIMPAGGFRELWNDALITEKICEDGIPRKGYQAHINGLKVFEFSIREIAKNIRETITFAGIEKDNIDYLILHQANKMINDTIQKQLKIESNKFLNSMYYYGNTGAASVPLTIVSQMKSILSSKTNKMLLSGFGVGLSWASMILDIDKIKTFDVIEY